MSSSDSENELSNTPPNIIQLAANSNKNLLPEKSREGYEKVYQQWTGVQKIQLAANSNKNLLPEKSREGYEKVYQQWTGVQKTM
ncbi:hypothetical protein QE152_g1976 [Popillia japonica]|uniref:Uncharacterized protein n=1 Tax=Popillia japonica TaxID=7064 RepID=A0AAW1N6Q4_POPJA